MALSPLSPLSTRTAVRTRSIEARVRAARLIAGVVDLFQIVAWPLFLPGAASIANDLLDLATAIALTRLLGWHFAFLPTFAAELIPGVDLVPSWTLAVFLATRGRPKS